MAPGGAERREKMKRKANWELEANTELEYLRRAERAEEALVQVIVRVSGRAGWGENGLMRACAAVEEICQAALRKF
jgi:hypothetical protein